MNKLTAIKIKYEDGTYSDEIPVSVLAENVEWDSTHTLVDVLGSIDVDVTGTIQDQINQLFNEKANSSEVVVLKSRIDNLIKLESGSTTGDAELQDIRVGYDGTVYDTAGDAVRGQIGQLSESIVNISDGLGLESIELQDIRVGLDGNTYNTAGDAVRGQIGQLSESIVNISDGLGLESIYKPVVFEQNNKYISLTGESIYNNRWATYEAYAPVAFIKNIAVPMYKGASCVALYDKDKNFIRGIQGKGVYQTTKELFTDLSLVHDATYLRFCLEYEVREGFSLEWITIPEKTNEINHSIDELNDLVYKAKHDVSNLNGKLYDYTYDKANNNMVASEYATTGQGLHITSEITIGSTKYDENVTRYGAMWYKSPLKEVGESKSIKYTNLCSWVEWNAIVPIILFFDDSQRIISYFVHEYEEKKGGLFVSGRIDIPYGAKYFCIQTSNITDTTSIPFSEQYVYLSNSNEEILITEMLTEQIEGLDKGPMLSVKSWNGKKCAFIGDSITYGIGTTKTYHQYMKDVIGIENYNYARNGATVQHMLDFANNLFSEHPDCDAIFVLGGTNDFNSNIPIGDFFTETDEIVNVNGQMVTRKMKTMSSSSSTFKGRLNNLISNLKTNYPNSQIVLMTPLHRGYASFGSNNIQPPENYANGVGSYIDDYVNAVKMAGSIWSCPVIDLFNDSGLYPLNEQYYKYFANSSTDRLHPNALGHQRIAKTIINRLNNIPVELIV